MSMLSLFPYVLVALFFLVGLIIGSFLNVVIIRGERGESLGGRSRCDACKSTLGVWELIPVVSFVIQKRRCRGCGAVFSWQYPIVEGATALFFAGVAGYFLMNGAYGGSLSRSDIVAELLIFPMIASLVVLVVSDLRYQILPDGAVLVLFLSGAGMSAIRGHVAPDIAVAALIALFFAALWFFSHGTWMGLGDAKLVLATSLVAGYPYAIAAFLFSFWLGGLVGITLLVLGARSIKSRIPFGPCIIAGMMLAIFFADRFFSYTGLGILL